MRVIWILFWEICHLDLKQSNNSYCTCFEDLNFTLKYSEIAELQFGLRAAGGRKVPVGCVPARCPPEQEHGPVLGSVDVLFETVAVREQNVAERVYTRSYSEVLVIPIHSFGFILLLDEVKQLSG